jgi:hypothetical protein
VLQRGLVDPVEQADECRDRLDAERLQDLLRPLAEYADGQALDLVDEADHRLLPCARLLVRRAGRAATAALLGLLRRRVVGGWVEIIDRKFVLQSQYQ